MYFFTRFRVAQFGHEVATFRDESLDFRDASTGLPTDTLIHAPNGTGKTSLLGAFFTVLVPGQRHFMPTIADRNRHFKDYLDPRGIPALMALELYADGGLAPIRYVIGQMAALKSDGDDQAPNRVYFSYHENGVAGFETLPATTGAGSDLKNWEDAQAWLIQAKARAPQTFFSTTSQTDWESHLLENGVDVDVYAKMPEFSKSEGGIDSAILQWHNEAEFLRVFFNFTLPPQRSEETREIIATATRRMRDKPRLIKKQKAIQTLEKAFAGFNLEAAARAIALEVNRAATRKLSLTIAALLHVKQNKDAALDRTTLAAKEQATRAEQLECEVVSLDTALEHAQAAQLRLTLVDAESAHDAAKSVLGSLQRRGRALKAARRQSRIRDLQRAIQGVEAQIIAADAGLGDFLREAVAAGSRYLQALAMKGARIEEALEDLRTSEQSLNGEVSNCGQQMTTATRLRNLNTGALSEVAVKVSAISKSAATLLAKGSLLAASETAADARLRLSNSVVLLTTQLSELSGKQAQFRSSRELALKTQMENRALVRTLTQELAAATGLNASVQAQFAKLRQSPATTRFGAPEHVDFAAADFLSSVDAHTMEQVRLRADVHAELARISAERESIERTQLARANPDVERVIERLQASGVSSAKSHLAYLAAVELNVQKAQRLFNSDPARMGGVAVTGVEQLALARTVAMDGLELSSPVVVSSATLTAGEGGPLDGFIVPVTNAAAFNKEAARAEAVRLAQHYAETEGRASVHAAEVQSLDVLRRLVQDLQSKLAGRTPAEVAASVLCAQEDLALAEQTAARAEAQVLAIETNETEARAQLEALRGDLEQTRQRLLSVEAFLEVEAELPILLRDRESLTAEQLALDATLGNLEGERVRLGLQRTHVAERTVSNRRDLDEVKIAQTLVRYGALGPDPRAVVESSVTLEMCQALYSAARQIYESESTARVGGLRSQRDEYAKAMEAEKSELASDLGDLTAVDIEPLVDVDHAAEAFKLEAALAKGQGELDRRHTEHTEARLLQKAFLEKRRYHDEAQGEVFTNAALAQARAGELAATLALARVSLGQVIATIGTLRVTLAELKGQVKELKTQVTRYPLTDVPMHEGLPLATPDELIDMGQGIIEEVDVRAAAAKLAAGAYAAADKRTDGLYTSFLRILGQEEITSTLSASMLADLTSTTADTAAENAAELADAFSERRKVLEDEIAQIEMDFASTIEELDSFVSDSIGILKSAISKTVPESIEVYGKAAILKVRDRAALNVASDTRRERLRYYLDRLIDNQRFPETGGQLAADAVLMALGTSNVGFRILKVSQHRTIEYTPIDKITGSGGERVIAATLLWAVMAKAKRDHMPRKTSGPLGVLSVDNFFGKLTNEEMLRLLRTFTRELGVQCIFTTLSLDVDVVAVYPKVLQFRKGKTALGPNGRSYVAQAPYQGLKDPATLKSTAS